MDEERYAHVLDSIDGALDVYTGDMHAGHDEMRWVPPEDTTGKLTHSPTAAWLYTYEAPEPVRGEYLGEVVWARREPSELDEDTIRAWAENMAQETVRVRGLLIDTIQPAFHDVVRNLRRVMAAIEATGIELPEPDNRTPQERALDLRRTRSTGPQDRPGGRYGKSERRHQP